MGPVLSLTESFIGEPVVDMIRRAARACESPRFPLAVAHLDNLRCDSIEGSNVLALTTRSRAALAPTRGFECKAIRAVVDGQSEDEELVAATVHAAMTGEWVELSKVLELDLDERICAVDEASRRAVSDDFMAMMEDAGVDSRTAQGPRYSLNEMLMNVNAHARESESGQSRRARVRWGINDEYIGVAVCDAAGTFSVERALRYFDRCLKVEKPTPETKVSGAGLGLFFVLMASTRLVVNIEPGVATEIVLLRKRIRSPQFAKTAPMVNIQASKQPVGAARLDF